MCLGLPGRLISVARGATMAKVEVAGVVRDIDVSQVAGPLVPGVYLLVHSGFALERISPERANEALSPFAFGEPDGG
jgi:hydrogenase expression/formation protein HypC